MKELTYICQEIKNPLKGIHFANSFLEATDLTEDQKQFMGTSRACEKQIQKVVGDVHLENNDDK